MFVAFVVFAVFCKAIEVDERLLCLGSCTDITTNCHYCRDSPFPFMLNKGVRRKCHWLVPACCCHLTCGFAVFLKCSCITFPLSDTWHTGEQEKFSTESEGVIIISDVRKEHHILLMAACYTARSNGFCLQLRFGMITQRASSLCAER